MCCYTICIQGFRQDVSVNIERHDLKWDIDDCGILRGAFDPFVRSYAGDVSRDCILMDDNACRHRASDTDVYMERETIENMDGPARSPYRNPTEHACAMLQRTVLAV